MDFETFEYHCRQYHEDSVHLPCLFIFANSKKRQHAKDKRQSFQGLSVFLRRWTSDQWENDTDFMS